MTVSVLERCGNTEFCGGTMAPDEDGILHCSICGKTKAQGRARMEEIRVSTLYKTQRRAEEEAKQRQQEELDRMDKEDELMAIQGNPKQRERSIWLEAHVGEIAADMKVMSVREVLAKWNISSATVYRYQKLGKLPFMGFRKELFKPDEPAKTPEVKKTSQGTPSPRETGRVKGKLLGKATHERGAYIKAHIAEIAADCGMMRYSAWKEKWGLSKSTIYKYRKLGLLPYPDGIYGEPAKVAKPLANMPNDIPTQADKDIPGNNPVQKEAVFKQSDSVNQRVTQPDTGHPYDQSDLDDTKLPSWGTITVKFVPAIPPLPSFSRWWWPSVQVKWLEVYRELAGKK